MRRRICIRAISAAALLTVLTTFATNLGAAITSKQALQFRVIAYYPAWLHAALPSDKIKFEYLTHINHAFAWPLADGSITHYSNLVYPQLIAAARHAGVKVLISMGGWGQSSGFSPMAADSLARSRFTQNLITFMQLNGYDGVDLDWEHPQTQGDQNNQNLLVKEIRQAFSKVKPSWLLTMAVGSTDWSGRWNDYAELSKYVDWYNMMTYDFHGSWTNHAGHNSPLLQPTSDRDGSTQESVRYMTVSRGVPKEKVVIGIPFYGREFLAAQLYGPGTAGSDLIFTDIAKRIGLGWDYFWDDVSKVPYLLNASRTRFLTFDDSTSVSHKCQYAKDNGLAGVMFWAMGQDVIGNSQPLLEAIGRETRTPVAVGLPEAQPMDFELLQNYPNPFNSTTVIRFRTYQRGQVRITVTDLLGRLLVTLVDDEHGLGDHSVSWDGAQLGSGVYLCRMTFNGHQSVRSLIILR